MTTRYRVEYALKTHRRDQLIEWIKGMSTSVDIEKILCLVFAQIRSTLSICTLSIVQFDKNS